MPAIRQVTLASRVGVMIEHRHQQNVVVAADTYVIGIDHEALGENGRIEIRDFVVGTRDLGLTLNATNQVQAGLGSATVHEGEALTLPLQLAAPAQVGQRLHWQINPAYAGLFRVVNGAETFSFNPDGTLSINVEAGHSTFMFSLIPAGDVEQDAAVGMNVVLIDSGGNPVGDAANIDLNVIARTGSFEDPVTTNTIDAFDPNSVQGRGGQ